MYLRKDSDACDGASIVIARTITITDFSLRGWRWTECPLAADILVLVLVLVLVLHVQCTCIHRIVITNKNKNKNRNEKH